MSAYSTIEWTDHTFNPWRGCRKVAPECAHCYITTTFPFRTRGQVHGGERVRAGVATLKEPLRWNREAEESGGRWRVFCLSLGDWLDDENVPIEWLSGLMQTIHDTPNLDWLLLTKRPQNWLSRISSAYASFRDRPSAWMLRDWLLCQPPANVWIGVSAGADQAAALDIPARIHFLSAEPMLGPLNTTHAAGFNWIIFGGESGIDARPLDTQWIRDGLTFCRSHGIKSFVKQLGSNVVCPQDVAAVGQLWPYGMHLQDDHGKWHLGAFSSKKAGNPEEWPEDLRVREFPV